MGWEWRPETPEEIAEHQRMRKKLIECQQMHSDSNDKAPIKVYQNRHYGFGKIAVILVICFIIFGIIRFFSSEKTVSQNASAYIQQTHVINNILEGFIPKLNDDFAGDSNVDYKVYEKDIAQALAEIKVLQEKSIFQFDDMYKYQIVSEAYYEQMYSFLYTVQQKQEISIFDYNKFCLKINSLKNPHNCLIELFDEKGYYYTIDSDGVIHYKVKNLII